MGGANVPCYRERMVRAPLPRPRDACRVGAALLVLLASWACSSSEGSSLASRDQIEPVVARDAVPFDPGTLPDALVARLAGARVALLGEMHYVQEHQELLALLLARLQAAGFRWILQEQPHGTAWTGDEYVALRSDVLPVDVDAFNRTLLDGVRALNAALPEGERLRFAGFDMNFGARTFVQGVTLFQERFGRVAQLDALLAAAPDSSAYAAALDALPAALEGDAAGLSATLGPDRYAQLLDLVDVERRSRPLRIAGDTGPGREALIRERILHAVSGAGGAGVAVNCGRWHAQQAAEMLPPDEPVGAWLAAHPETYGGDPAALVSIAFYAARGERLASWDAPAATSFDAVRDAPPNDLVRILAERAGSASAWLPFDDPLFAGWRMLAYGGGAFDVLHPGAAFDGMVLYPDATILASLALVR